jgi:hypothetical protein
MTAELNPPPPVSVSGEAPPHEAVNCPLCDYDLRGLVEPRCPECGYRFEWAELLDPTRRRHRFLFEHHPEHNVWSFCRTAAAGLRPARFWRSLSPVQRSSPRRLALYGGVIFLITLLLGPIAFHLHTALSLLATGAVAGWSNALWLAWDFESPPLLFVTFGCYVLWAVTTYLSLLIFRISMRRARIRPVHVARCVVYSFDAVVWLAAGLFAAAAATMALALLLSKRDFTLLTVIDFAAFLLVPLVVYRLVTAYKHYLRFDHPFLTVLASQVIAGLVVLNVLVLVENLRH